MKTVWAAWSDEDAVGMLGFDVRGKWAGNCFNIVVEERLKEDIIARGGEWDYRAWSEMVRLFRLNMY